MAAVSQRLDLADGLWTCPGCGAQLTSGDLHGGDEGANLEHQPGCAEVATMAGASDMVLVSTEDLVAVLRDAEGFIGGKDNAAFSRLAAAAGVE